jgi:hypothetical protein
MDRNLALGPGTFLPGATTLALAFSADCSCGLFPPTAVLAQFGPQSRDFFTQLLDLTLQTFQTSQQCFGPPPGAALFGPLSNFAGPFGYQFPDPSVSGFGPVGDHDSLAFSQRPGPRDEFFLPLRDKHGHMLAPLGWSDDDTHVSAFAYPLLREADKRSPQLTDTRPFLGLQDNG